MSSIFYKNLLSNNIIKLVIATGPAGTGKTMMACEEAINHLKNSFVKKIVITRPIIGADNDIGFLPGKLEDKMTPWTRPLLDIFHEHFTKKRVEQMITNDIIEISPFIYMRGRTFKNCFIIGDELQNTNIEQMKMLLTRIGDNSKMVITGDLEQKDIKNQESGLEHLMKILKNNPNEMIGVIQFNNDDVKRSEITKKILEIYSQK